MDQKIQIKASNDELKGRYSTIAMLSLDKEEFVMDFITNFPPAPELVSRIIMSPAHAKRYLKILKEQIERYEATFGNLEVAENIEQGFGFRQEV